MAVFILPIILEKMYTILLIIYSFFSLLILNDSKIPKYKLIHKEHNNKYYKDDTHNFSYVRH